MDMAPLYALLDDPQMPVPVDWMRQCTQEAPWFTLPATLLLARNPGDISEEERHLLIQHLALTVADKEAFVAMIDPAEAEMAAFYPPREKPQQIDTSQAIDTFLSQYCPTAAEDATLDQLILNPQPDYSSVLESGEDVARDARGDATPALPPMAESEPSEPSEPSQLSEQPPHHSPLSILPSEKPSLTESLAHIYIRQGRYQKAYDILSQINLDNPEKSPYFADQLRYLRLLIINSKHSETSS